MLQIINKVRNTFVPVKTVSTVRASAMTIISDLTDIEDRNTGIAEAARVTLDAAQDEITKAAAIRFGLGKILAEQA